jgi:hypothetical protein
VSRNAPDTGVFFVSGDGPSSSRVAGVTDGTAPSTGAGVRPGERGTVEPVP